MTTFKIVKSKNIYRCEACGKIIPKGIRYGDYCISEISPDKRYFTHIRYHLSCVDSEMNSKQKISQDEIVTKLFTKLSKEGAFPVSHNGIKEWICGVVFKCNKTPYIVVREWNNPERHYITVDRLVAEYWDEEGYSVV